MLLICFPLLVVVVVAAAAAVSAAAAAAVVVCPFVRSFVCSFVRLHL